MRWVYQFEDRALRELKRLSRTDQERVLRYLKQRVIASGDPKAFGKALRNQFAGLWRYRIGDVRMICRLEDDRLVVLVVKVGHRRNVYE